MQVFFERLIIPRFRLIARSSRGTILEDLCNRLAIDDGIHHGAGMAYERVLLESARRRRKQTLIDAANRMLPEFAQHALWRPKAREMIGHADGGARPRAFEDGARPRRAARAVARARRQRGRASVLTRCNNCAPPRQRRGGCSGSSSSTPSTSTRSAPTSGGGHRRMSVDDVVGDVFLVCWRRLDDVPGRVRCPGFTRSRARRSRTSGVGARRRRTSRSTSRTSPSPSATPPLRPPLPS